MTIDPKIRQQAEDAHSHGQPVAVLCDPEAVPFQDQVTGRILCLAFSKVQYEEATAAGEGLDEYLEQFVVVDSDLGFVSIDLANVHGFRSI